MTQAKLALAAGIHQPTVAAYESGRRMPSDDTLRKVLAAARLRPSIALAVLADEINAAAAAHGIFDVRVFGSVLQGHDTERSDIDLLVAARENVSYSASGLSSRTSRISRDSPWTSSPKHRQGSLNWRTW